MKSCLVLNCPKFHQIIYDTTASMHQQVLCSNCTRKKSSWVIACSKLAPTLARQM